MKHRTRGLRVIAGAHRGRKLVAPDGDRVRPTKDMVREAMFSALDARHAIVEANVLDLYAGSGALAIEALSRGAARAVLVERSRAALDAIATNVSTIGLGDEARVVNADVGRFLRGLEPAESPFDLVFADPPYDTADADAAALLDRLAASSWLAPDAIVSVERPARHPVSAPEGFRTGWERSFGDTLVAFYWR
jgi:16S rRNA (guanine966-N2)-methyltransferase